MGGAVVGGRRAIVMSSAVRTRRAAAARMRGLMFVGVMLLISRTGASGVGYRHHHTHTGEGL